MPGSSAPLLPDRRGVSGALVRVQTTSAGISSAPVATGEMDHSPIGVIDIRGRRVRPEVTPVLADPHGVRARRLSRFGRVVAVLSLLWVAGLGLAGLGILPAGDLPLGGALTGTAPATVRGAPAPVPPGPSDPLDATLANAGTASATLDSTVLLPAGNRRAESVALDGTPGSAGVARGHPSSTATGGGGSSAAARSLAPVTGARGETFVASTTGATGGTSGMAGAASGTVAGPSSSTGDAGTHASGHGRVVAPGQIVRETTPGHLSTTARGNAATAPGQVKQTTKTTTTATTTATITTAPTTTAVTRGRSGAAPGQAVTRGSGHVRGA